MKSCINNLARMLTLQMNLTVTRTFVEEHLLSGGHKSIIFSSKGNFRMFFVER